MLKAKELEQGDRELDMKEQESNRSFALQAHEAAKPEDALSQMQEQVNELAGLVQQLLQAVLGGEQPTETA